MNTPFKEPFILAFVRAKAPCFRCSHILGTQNVKVKHPTAPKH
ncbi:hypothetical protein [Helicobacter pylori]|nr:hypothetical protein [Helicobacter pylori]